jgi:hypothetical protein
MKLSNRVIVFLVMTGLTGQSAWSLDSASATDQSLNLKTASAQMVAATGTQHGGGGGAAPSRPAPVQQQPSRPDGGGQGGRPEQGQQPGRPVEGRPGEGRGRAYDPVFIHAGVYAGRHWDHPYFVRPIFNDWVWDSLRLVTCTAEDSDGDQFPVTENEYTGIEFQAKLPEIEDAALDMCFDETNGDTSCVLVGCTPGY